MNRQQRTKSFEPNDRLQAKSYWPQLLADIARGEALSAVAKKYQETKSTVYHAVKDTPEYLGSQANGSRMKMVRARNRVKVKPTLPQPTQPPQPTLPQTAQVRPPTTPTPQPTLVATLELNQQPTPAVTPFKKIKVYVGTYEMPGNPDQIRYFRGIDLPDAYQVFRSWLIEEGIHPTFMTGVRFLHEVLCAP
jgi:hypothetical protein